MNPRVRVGLPACWVPHRGAFVLAVRCTSFRYAWAKPSYSSSGSMKAISHWNVAITFPPSQLPKLFFPYLFFSVKYIEKLNKKYNNHPHILLESTIVNILPHLLSLHIYNKYIKNMYIKVIHLKISQPLGLPWWSSGQDYVLPMQGAWVQSLVGELDPTCMRQLRLRLLQLRVCMPQLRVHTPQLRVCMPQPKDPTHRN